MMPKGFIPGFKSSGRPTDLVSMTINGPAATMTAFFVMNTGLIAIVKYKSTAIVWRMNHQQLIQIYTVKGNSQDVPIMLKFQQGNEMALGLKMLLGVNGWSGFYLKRFIPKIKPIPCKVRGTVQADIFKRSQSKNTCIFFDWVFPSFDWEMCSSLSCENSNSKFLFSVYFQVTTLLEAGENPINNWALTLSNGFTYVEYSCGVEEWTSIQFCRQIFLSSFRMNWPPKYAVHSGGVARRIWLSNEVEIWCKWTVSNGWSIIFRPRKMLQRARIDFQWYPNDTSGAIRDLWYLQFAA